MATPFPRPSPVSRAVAPPPSPARRRRGGNPESRASKRRKCQRIRVPGGEEKSRPPGSPYEWRLSEQRKSLHVSGTDRHTRGWVNYPCRPPRRRSTATWSAPISSHVSIRPDCSSSTLTVHGCCSKPAARRRATRSSTFGPTTSTPASPNWKPRAFASLIRRRPCTPTPMAPSELPARRSGWRFSKTRKATRLPS